MLFARIGVASPPPGHNDRSPVERTNNAPTEWLQPPGDQQGLKRYIETLRERRWLVVALVILTTLAAALYVFTADEVYEAEAELLVTPLSEDAAANLAGLGLIPPSGDPLRSVETAATLIETDSIAARAAEILGIDRKPSAVLDDISVDPVATSDILTVTAHGGSPEEAAGLANAFADAAIEVRTEQIHDRIDAQLPQLEARLDALPEGATRDVITTQVAAMETLRAGDDPSLQRAERATVPESPVSPRKKASIAAGIIGGLILGIGAAFALQVLDPRLRREAQLRTRYRLPVLARVPRERSRKADPLVWERLSPGAIEAYRRLRAILARPWTRSGGPGSILVTSPGPSEGKTTTALNLATSLALSGKRVILIEADLRRPSIAKALGITVNRGVISVLIEEARLEQSLLSSPTVGDNLQLLLAEQAGVWGGELLALPAAQRLVDESKLLADYVVVDSPPLATVIDALPLARTVNDILLVVRLGSSSLGRIHELAELLADTGIRPTGFVVLGTPRTPQAYYGEYRRGAAFESESPVSARYS